MWRLELFAKLNDGVGENQWLEINISTSKSVCQAVSVCIPTSEFHNGLTALHGLVHTLQRS